MVEKKTNIRQNNKGNLTARNVTVNSIEPRRIDASTPIIFNVRNFFALIGSMLGVFFGFYLLVINPKIVTIENTIEKTNQEQKIINENINKTILEIKLNQN